MPYDTLGMVLDAPAPILDGTGVDESINRDCYNELKPPTISPPRSRNSTERLDDIAGSNSEAP